MVVQVSYGFVVTIVLPQLEKAWERAHTQTGDLLVLGELVLVVLPLLATM
jgi:hypothetical protein